MRRNIVANHEVYVNLGKMIRGFRIVEEITSAQLAAIVGVTPRTMQRIETGQIHCPIHVLLAVAEAFDLSLDFDLFPVTTEVRKSA